MSANLSRSNANVNPEFRQGWHMFFAGKLISECHNLDERAGYLAAEAYCEDSYYRCMMAEVSA